MNIETLQSKIDRDLTTRKRELVAHSQLLNTVSDESQKKFLLRFGVVLLYSHWEGFIKCGIHHLLEFYKNTPLCNVPKNVLTAFIMGYLKKIEHYSHLPHKNLELIQFIREDGALQDINIRNCFNFESNINYEVFEKVLFTCCCEEDFSTKKNLIDKDFVSIRHKIAHGEGYSIKDEDFDNIKREIMSLLERVRDIIITTASSEYDN